MGFLSSLGLILWLPFASIGTLVATMYSVYFGYSYLGLVSFVIINVGLAVYLNKARKHSRADAFDDRLTFEKMDQARDWWISKNSNDDE